MRLQGKTYESICDPSVSPFFDKSWDFKGVRFDGNIKRQLKLGVAAVAAAAQRVLDPVHVIQVEAGEVPADKIAEYARRLNLLLNVSPDGYVCLYRPNYDQEPLYAFRCRDNDALNNIISAEVMEDARTLWDEVIVVGEQIGYEGSVDSQNPNATKKRGRVVHEGILPFKNRKTAADGEMYQNGLAQKQAEWMYKKGIFEAFYINYTVSEHHQNGYWYEANTMAHIDDDELGLTGNYWVQSVRCTGSKQGADETVVTLRKPGLLSAAFGEIPAPPIYYASGITGAPHPAP
jgi:prophage tail gpP-like protein